MITISDAIVHCYHCCLNSDLLNVELENCNYDNFNLKWKQNSF